MRILLTTILLFLSHIAVLTAQKPAAAAPSGSPSVELIQETTFDGLTEQRAASIRVAPAAGGGVTITANSDLNGAVYLPTVTSAIPVMARVSVDLEIRQFGSRGVAVSLGDQADQAVTAVLVTLSAGGMLSVGDRAGNVVITPRQVAGIGAAGPAHLVVDVRGSAIAVSVNGGPAAQGVAGALIDGTVHLVGWGGADFTVRRVRLERLVGVPPAQLVLRTSERVAVPVVRPARYFDNERSGGGSISADTMQNIVTLAAPDTIDYSSFAERLGRLPAAVRIEADASMPRTCEQRTIGLLFGRPSGGPLFGLLLTPMPPYMIRLYRLTESGQTGLGGSISYLVRPFETPSDHKHLTIELRDRSIAWSVDGGRLEQVQVDDAVPGIIGVIAGPGCTARFANLRITPLS